jgi:hypothetical protein
MVGRSHDRRWPSTSEAAVRLLCLPAVRPWICAFVLVSVMSPIARASQPVGEQQPISTVALFEFTGDEELTNDVRARIGDALAVRGHEPHHIQASMLEVAGRVARPSAGACPPAAQARHPDMIGVRCLLDVTRKLYYDTGTLFDYLVWADLPRDGLGEIHVFAFKGGIVVDLDMHMSSEDLALPLALGDEVARRIHERHEPAEPPDEPSPEPYRPEVPQPYLPRDFLNYCRLGPREDSKFTGRDLRPPCKLGPAFGYFRPRTWTLLSLTGASLVGTGALYGLAFGAPPSWPSATTERLEVAAHVALASTVVLGTVFSLVIVIDREQAKRFMQTLKMEYLLVRVAPMGIAVHWL